MKNNGKQPSNLMRLRERLSRSGKILHDREEFGSEDPNVQLETLNELCMMTKGTPAYPLAQAKLLIVMKQMEQQ